jgi:hypothetical protein
MYCNEFGIADVSNSAAQLWRQSIIDKLITVPAGTT